MSWPEYMAFGMVIDAYGGQTPITAVIGLLLFVCSFFVGRKNETRNDY